MRGHFIIIALVASCVKSIAVENYDPFEYFMNSYIDNFNISSQCKISLQWYRDGIRNMDLQAMKMFDATGRVESGLLSGHITFFGDYDQCLEVKKKRNNATIAGQYCLVTIKASRYLPQGMQYAYQDETEKMELLSDNQNIEFLTTIQHVRIGVCIPALCTATDLQELLPSEFTYVSEDLCYTQERLGTPYSKGTIATISFFGFLLAVVMVCTIGDLIHHNYNFQGKLPELMKALSASNNIRKLFNTEREIELPCISGVISVAMMLIVLGHTFLMFIFVGLLNPVKLLDFHLNWSSMFFKELHLHVETFFTIGGLLAVYTYLEARRRGIYFNILLYYLHRFLRIYPVLIVCVLVSKDLNQYFGDGPLWGLYDKIRGDCQKDWWIPLTFLGNYIWDDTAALCLTESWYLCIDIQMRLLSPLLLIPLGKHPKLTLYALFALIILGIIVQAAVMLTKDLSAFGWLYFGTKENIMYMRKYYEPLHTRFAPYIIGMIGGYFLHRHQHSDKKIRLPWLASLIMWAFIVIGGIVCIYAGKDVYIHRSTVNSTWFSLKRPAWATLIVCLIFMCTINPEGYLARYPETKNTFSLPLFTVYTMAYLDLTSDVSFFVDHHQLLFFLCTPYWIFTYFGPMSKFLSCSMFRVISRFSLGIYLIHLTILTTNSLSARTLHEFTYKNLFKEWCRGYVLSILLAIVFALVAEAPIIYFEKRILGKALHKSVEKEKGDQSVSVKL